MSEIRSTQTEPQPAQTLASGEACTLRSADTVSSRERGEN